MITIEPDFWKTENGVTSVRCYYVRCRLWIALTEYTISPAGVISPVPVRCPHCERSQGPLRLRHWQPA